MQFKISVTGDLGSGKSTICDLLTKLSGAKRYSTGTILREIAESRNMSVLELNRYMETHPEIDLDIDNGLKALSASKDNLIIDSRMAWHFTENTFKVYLAVDIEEAARRIIAAHRGKAETYVDLADAVTKLKQRRESEYVRYLSMYNTDCKNYLNFDLVIDTTFASPNDVAQEILSNCKKYFKGEKIKNALFAPGRLIPLNNDYKNEDKFAEIIKFNDSLYIYKGVEFIEKHKTQVFVPCNIIATENGTVEGMKVEEYLKKFNV